VRGLFDGHDAPTIPGLTTLPVGSAEEVEAALARGQGKRAVTATKCNAESSRSHSILSVVVKRRKDGYLDPNHGKLHLVDLAGSERVGKSGVSGQALKEAQNINSSLSQLGNVMSALQEKSRPDYRSSTLTKLLSDSLGGNSKTFMFVNINPSSGAAPETKCSLEFAERVRKVTRGQTTGRMQAGASRVDLDAALQRATAAEQRAASLEREVAEMQSQHASSEARALSELRDEMQAKVDALTTALRTASEQRAGLEAALAELRDTEAVLQSAEQQRQRTDGAAAAAAGREHQAKVRHLEGQVHELTTRLHAAEQLAVEARQAAATSAAIANARPATAPAAIAPTAVAAASAVTSTPAASLAATPVGFGILDASPHKQESARELHEALRQAAGERLPLVAQSPRSAARPPAPLNLYADAIDASAPSAFGGSVPPLLLGTAPSTPTAPKAAPAPLRGQSSFDFAEAEAEAAASFAASTGGSGVVVIRSAAAPAAAPAATPAAAPAAVAAWGPPPSLAWGPTAPSVAPSPMSLIGASPMPGTTPMPSLIAPSPLPPLRPLNMAPLAPLAPLNLAPASSASAAGAQHGALAEMPVTIVGGAQPTSVLGSVAAAAAAWVPASVSGVAKRAAASAAASTHSWLGLMDAEVTIDAPLGTVMLPTSSDAAATPSPRASAQQGASAPSIHVPPAAPAAAPAAAVPTSAKRPSPPESESSKAARVGPAAASRRVQFNFDAAPNSAPVQRSFDELGSDDEDETERNGRFGRSFGPSAAAAVAAAAAGAAPSLPTTDAKKENDPPSAPRPAPAAELKTTTPLSAAAAAAPSSGARLGIGLGLSSGLNGPQRVAAGPRRATGTAPPAADRPSLAAARQSRDNSHNQRRMSMADQAAVEASARLRASGR